VNRNVFIGIVVLVIIGAGTGFFVMNAQKKQTSQPLSPTTSTAPQPTSNNAFTSIQDALSKSMSLSCDFTDDKGRKTISYIKNGQIRTDITSSNPQESGSIIIKDKKMYFWNSTKQGFMMDLSNIQPSGLPKDKKPQKGISQKDEIMKNLEEYKTRCKPAGVDDSLFTIPSDITFSDFSSMFKTPISGQAVPSIDQKQIEKMPEQYKSETSPGASQ